MHFQSSPALLVHYLAANQLQKMMFPNSLPLTRPDRCLINCVGQLSDLLVVENFLLALCVPRSLKENEMKTIADDQTQENEPRLERKIPRKTPKFRLNAAKSPAIAPDTRIDFWCSSLSFEW